MTRTVKRDNSNHWFEITDTDRSDPPRDACRWLWDHSEGRRSYDRHRRIIGPRAYRSHTLGGRPKEDTHWRRFRHHDALNSRCYDGPPHRPRRSGPVPVWLRRADVVMKTPEFSFHDRRGAPNPRANNCRGPGLASVCGRARATHGMKGMLLNRPPTSGYESRCSSAAALKATNSSAKHRPLWLQRLRSWAGNVTQGAPNEPSTQRGLMPAASDVQWLVGPLHDNFRYIWSEY